MWDLIVAPFMEFIFMRNALLGACILSLSACPVGVFLTLRRMSLAGDAMSHAILPGVAAAFMFFGLDLVPMTIGGVVAGALVASIAALVSRVTIQKEDSSLATFYLMSLAAGVIMVSLRGSSVDLMHVLFGSVLALNTEALHLIAIVSGLSIALVIVLWRALIAECLDPLFFRSVSRLGGITHLLFLAIVVLNLVAGFQALGTLLAVGLMILPAAAARFWTQSVRGMCVCATIIGLASSGAGLLLSYHASVPSGPAIILSAGAAYLASLILAPRGAIITRLPRRTSVERTTS